MHESKQFLENMDAGLQFLFLKSQVEWKTEITNINEILTCSYKRKENSNNHYNG